MTIEEAKYLIDEMSHHQRLLRRWIRIQSKGKRWADIQDEDVINVVSDVTGVSKKDIRSISRKSQVVMARNIVMYLMNVHLGKPTKKTGRFVNRDHATCIYAVKVMRGYIDLYNKHNVDDMGIVSKLMECERLLELKSVK
jgi:chromosomal replication initiator protein